MSEPEAIYALNLGPREFQFEMLKSELKLERLLLSCSDFGGGRLETNCCCCCCCWFHDTKVNLNSYLVVVCPFLVSMSEKSAKLFSLNVYQTIDRNPKT